MAVRLPEPLRRRPWALILGLAFAWLAFLAGPEWAMERNQALGWPRWRHPAGQGAALLVILGAGVVILRCSSLFARVGDGTPVPVAPPRHLVEQGLYRWSRNPIYVAYAAIWLGSFGLLGHAALLLYAVACIGITHLLLVYWEEPGLRRRFGAEWDGYVRRVPRWIGRPAAPS
jgi:protein-S-isoprenylcysteine O-methyltransferase Ste14